MKKSKFFAAAGIFLYFTFSVSAYAAQETSPADTQSADTGWHMTSGAENPPAWQYIEAGNKTPVVSAFRTINDREYYFNENGNLMTDGMFEITGLGDQDGIYYAHPPKTADETPETGNMGILARNQWILIQSDAGNQWKYFGSDMKAAAVSGLKLIGEYYYFLDDDGHALSGFHPAGNGKDYYFGPEGIRADYTGWHTIDGQICYFNDQFQTDQNSHNGWLLVDNIWYWLENGAIKTGWLKQGNTWYYLSPQNGSMQTGLYQADNSWYYSTDSGAMLASCWINYDGNWHYLNPGGNAASGWKKLGTAWYYLDPATTIMKCGWADISGRRYYLGSANDGAMKYGWQQTDNEWYYLGGADDGSMKYGWQRIGRRWYYLAPADGTMEYGWQEINGNSYYLGGPDDGAMRYGWIYSEGIWRYLGSADDGAMKYGWQRIGGNWYYLNTDNGAMQSGWLNLNGVWYYLGSPDSGAMKYGWQQIGGSWYYFGNAGDGSMKTGWQLVNGCWYYFYKENDPHGGSYGAMASSTVIEGFEVGADGRWITGAGTLQTIQHTEYVQFWNTKTSVSMGQLSELNNAIAAFHNRGYQVSFVLLDINTGQAVSYKSGLSLYSASAIKGPYVLSVLDAGHAPTTSIWNTINWSSNSDYSAIRRTYGAAVFQNWLASAGVDTAQGARYYTATTSLDLAKMWLHGWDYLSSSRVNSDWARSTFQKVTNSPISARLSGAYTVYSKAGWYPGSGYYCVYNDAGIVRKGNSPYVLSVMSGCPGTSGAALMQNLIGRLDSIHSEMIR